VWQEFVEAAAAVWCGGECGTLWLSLEGSQGGTVELFGLGRPVSARQDEAEVVTSDGQLIPGSQAGKLGRQPDAQGQGRAVGVFRLACQGRGGQQAPETVTACRQVALKLQHLGARPRQLVPQQEHLALEPLGLGELAEACEEQPEGMQTGRLCLPVSGHPGKALRQFGAPRQGLAIGLLGLPRRPGGGPEAGQVEQGRAACPVPSRRSGSRLCCRIRSS
jgi:hypothetical protein